MNLECLNNIITDNLAIMIDLTDVKSWKDWNSGLTAFSLTKWSGAFSNNISLKDFGLTGFDNGRTNIMWSGVNLLPTDTIFSMYRVGYNDVYNPVSGQTSGVTAITQYLPMSAVTGTTGMTGTSHYYFALNGGYLQGFFKLHGYDYELLPSRYNNGFTIETLLYLNTGSSGIFLMMGARAEDKYNPYFSGETITGTTPTGITTSLDNYLDAILEKETVKTSFPSWETMTETTYYEEPPVSNIKNNVIAFLLTEDKHLAYKYIDSTGITITNASSTIISRTGFTWISISFKPDFVFTDLDLLNCDNPRKGTLTFYVNGRSVWRIKQFPEFFCRPFKNDKEKQLGVPYSISWGGGSFGLEHSYHYDYQTYELYTGQDDTYIDNIFSVEVDPIPTECYSIPTGSSLLEGLSLSADSSTFCIEDPCDINVCHPITVMRIEHTGNTATTYFIKFNQLISVLSNRDYVVNAEINDGGFFNIYAKNKVSIIAYSDETDIEIIESIEYIKGDGWKPLKLVFRTPDNSGQKFVNIGILIETDGSFNLDAPLFIKDFTYTAADILVKDPRKDGLTIQQNFNEPFIGGIQKLRIYDTALSSVEVMHNIIIESRNNPVQNIVVSKGGRIIYR